MQSQWKYWMHFPDLFIRIFLICREHHMHSKNVNKIFRWGSFFFSFRLIIFKEFPRQNDYDRVPTHFSIYVNSFKFVFLSRIISLFLVTIESSLSMYKQPTLLVSFCNTFYSSSHRIETRAFSIINDVTIIFNKFLFLSKEKKISENFPCNIIITLCLICVTRSRKRLKRWFFLIISTYIQINPTIITQLI